MQPAQNSINSWTIPTTDAEKTYYRTHAPKLRIYGIITTVVQILWTAVSLMAAKAVFDWAFERIPAFQFLSLPLAFVTLIALHSLMRTTTTVFWFDRLDGKTETDSSPLIPALILGALVLLDYQGAKIFLESTVKPAELRTTAEADTRYQAEKDAATADYKAAKGEAESIAKTRAAAARAQYGAQIAAVQNRRANTEADRRFIRGEVAKLKTKQAAELAQIESEKAAALAALLNAHNERTTRATAERDATNGETAAKNRAEEQRHAADMHAVGGVSWGVSLFFALLFSLLVYASVRIRVKSGILPVRNFTGLNAHGSPWHKIGIAIQDATTRQMHRFAVWLHRVLSAGARELRDFDGRVVFHELEEGNQAHQGGGSAIATAERSGRPIGFYKRETGGEEEEETGNVTRTRTDDFRSVVIEAGTRICDHCGNPYTYRHAKQRFCSDECRVMAWEARSGKQIRRGAVGRT